MTGKENGKKLISSLENEFELSRDELQTLGKAVRDYFGVRDGSLSTNEALEAYERYMKEYTPVLMKVKDVPIYQEISENFGAMISLRGYDIGSNEILDRINAARGKKPNNS